tara:strand:- start:382 stop:1197 length:816 start_codon:yes stop_codon:yes gene_type:complete
MLSIKKEYKYKWKHNGYFIIENAINNGKQCTQLATKILQQDNVEDFGNSGKLEFPTGYQLFDNNTLSEHLISIAEQLLNQPVLLKQSVIWKKSPGHFENSEQRCHMDYPNHMYNIIPNWNKPTAVAMIIYLNTAGATAFVGKQGNEHLYKKEFVINSLPGLNKYPYVNNKKKALEMLPHTQELYNKEIIIQPKQNSLICYRLDTWHRGVPTNKTRYTHSLIFATKHSTCQSWHRGWAFYLYRKSFINLLLTLSKKQLNTLNIIQLRYNSKL